MIITADMIKIIAPNSKTEIVAPMINYLNKYLPSYGIDSYLRICHFIAQAAHESASFRTLEEYADGSAYEGRKDLGNVNKGDGKRYKGRGIFQLTGRANYRDMSNKLKMDLENNPTLAATPEVSVLTALEYWKSRSLSTYADQDDVTTITKRINGGLNGFDQRKAYLAKAKTVIPKNFKFDSVPTTNVNSQITDAVTSINVSVAKIGDSSPYVADLQNMLIRKGYNIVADGAFGAKTEVAVKDFQSKNGLTITGRIDTNTLNKLMV